MDYYNIINLLVKIQPGPILSVFCVDMRKLDSQL